MSVLRLPAGALFLLGVVVAAPATARAEDADALIKRGVELRRGHKDLEALEQFRRAYDLAPTPRALAQMGLAEQALARWLDAEAHLARALDSGQDPWIAKYRETLESSRADVAKHLAWLEVAGRPAGAEVRVDGQLVGALPLPRMLRVVAGPVAVDVSAPGHLPFSRTLSVAPGQVAREDVALPPRPGSQAPAATDAKPRDGAPKVALADRGPRAAPDPGLRRAAWISLGVAVGLAAVAGTGFLVGEVEARRFGKAGCAEPLDDTCRDWKDFGTRARTVGTITAIGAGVAGLTAAALFVASRPEPARGEVACAPDLTRPGAACLWRF